MSAPTSYCFNRYPHFGIDKDVVKGTLKHREKFSAPLTAWPLPASF